MCRYRVDDAFLAGIEARSAHLFGDEPRGSTAGDQLRGSAARRIFLGRFDEASPGVIAHNVRAMANGLVVAGFVQTPQAAAEFLLHAALGKVRETEQLPKADTTGALAFLKTIDELGGLGATDEAVVESLNQLKEGVETFPRHLRPHREDWAQACEVFATERLMMSVIRRAAAEATVDSTAQEVPSANRRRMRAEV
jgi:hypothetical protein